VFPDDESWYNYVSHFFTAIFYTVILTRGTTDEVDVLFMVGALCRVCKVVGDLNFRLYTRYKME
jgi:hypothetical protein